MNPLELVFEVLGSQKALADALEISPQAITKWVNRGRVPAERVIDIERATGGAVTRHVLRPDIYPSEAAA